MMNETEKKESQKRASAKYKEAHPERIKESNRKSKRNWYENNKEIAKERVKEYQLRDPEKHKIRQKNYRDSHKDKLWIGAAKQRAKEKGLDFSINEDDVVVPEFCPILGIPLFRIGKKHSDNSPSIDRIDSTKGYIKGNVQVLSHKANILKNSATLSELIFLGEWAKLQLLEDEQNAQ
jgi:hypothetical protein